MQSEVLVRKAGLPDLDSIMEIENRCFQEDRFSRRQFSYLITKAKGLFLVVEDNGKTVAYLSLLANMRNRNLRIYSIAVHPGARGKGLAQRLLDEAARYACSKKLAGLSLEVNVNNLPAFLLYEKNGFIISHVKPHYYHDGADAYSMKRILD